jgi:flagellar hook-associated protein 2
MSTSSTNPLATLTGALDTSSSSGTTSGTGLGQGINVQQFVQYAVSDQEATITNLQNQQSTLSSENSEISTIQSGLTNLDNDANALSSTTGAFNAQTATSSNPDVLSASSDGTATAGIHSISVSNLATTSSWYTDSVATSSTQLVSGDNVAISVGGNQVANITIDSSNDTLDSLAAAINSATSAVQATVINDATGARLALVSNTSGAPGNISIIGTLHVASSGTAVNFNQGTQGLDANLTVDGVPIESASNTVTGVIPGVTLNLAAPTSVNGVDNPVSLTVAADTSQISTAISNLVNDYNTVTTAINGQFQVSSDGTASGVLENDDTLRQVQSMLLNAISYSTTGNNGIVNLASMGINMNDDGTLTVDTDTLNNALETNLPAVQNFLQNATSGFAQNLDSALQTINAPSTGMLSLDAAGNTSTSQDLTQQISDLQAALTVQEQELTTVYSNVNTTLEELPLLENETATQLSGIS